MDKSGPEPGNGDRVRRVAVDTGRLEFVAIGRLECDRETSGRSLPGVVGRCGLAGVNVAESCLEGVTGLEGILSPSSPETGVMGVIGGGPASMSVSQSQDQPETAASPVTTISSSPFVMSGMAAHSTLVPNVSSTTSSAKDVSTPGCTIP